MWFPCWLAMQQGTKICYFSLFLPPSACFLQHTKQTMKNPAANLSMQQYKSGGCPGSEQTPSLREGRFIRPWLGVPALLCPPNTWFKRCGTVTRGGCELWPQSSARDMSDLPWHLSKAHSLWKLLTQTSFLKNKWNKIWGHGSLSAFSICPGIHISLIKSLKIYM